MTTTFIIYPTTPVASVGRKMRSAFMVRTYANLLGALLAFMSIQAVFLWMQWNAVLAGYMAGYPWPYTLGGFMVIGWLAMKTARFATAWGTQYAALVMFTLVEGIVFTQLLHASLHVAPMIGPALAVAGVVCAAGLAGIGFVLREEFLFGRALKMWLVVAALAVGAGGLFGGFDPKACIAGGLAALSALAILHVNRTVLQEYSRDRHAAAALELFAAVPLLPWHAVRGLFGTRR